MLIISLCSALNPVCLSTRDLCALSPSNGNNSFRFEQQIWITPPNYQAICWLAFSLRTFAMWPTWNRLSVNHLQSRRCHTHTHTCGGHVCDSTLSTVSVNLKVLLPWLTALKLPLATDFSVCTYTYALVRRACVWAVACKRSACVAVGAVAVLRIGMERLYLPKATDVRQVVQMHFAAFLPLVCTHICPFVYIFIVFIMLHCWRPFYLKTQQYALLLSRWTCVSAYTTPRMLISGYNVPSGETHNKSVLVWLCSETECSGSQENRFTVHRLSLSLFLSCTHTYTHARAVSSACSVLFVRARLCLNPSRVLPLISPRLCVTLPFANKLRLAAKACDSQHQGGADVFLEALFRITWSESPWKWRLNSFEAELRCQWWGNRNIFSSCRQGVQMQPLICCVLCVSPHIIAILA